MAGAAMRALYDSAAKERQVESSKSAGVASGKSRKKKLEDETNVVAKVPPRSFEEDTVKPDPVPKKTSIKTRDQVGKLVGVSGRYIDDATKTG